MVKCIGMEDIRWYWVVDGGVIFLGNYNVGDFDSAVLLGNGMVGFHNGMILMGNFIVSG